MRNAITSLALLPTLALGAPERYTLDNGATVVLEPTPGVETVVVIAAYGAGFLADPPELPQAAHLGEHLRCTGATESWDAGESFARLNDIGAANAETLASLTYYDYTLPSDRLELALRVESERLASLRVTARDIAREGPRAAAELASVDASPQRPVGKFALMAIAQGWTHNATHVNLQTALGDAPAGSLRPALARHAPQNLTLLVVGDFDPLEAKRLIHDTIAAVDPAPEPPPPPVIDWDAQPERREMTWDAGARVVAIACDAPDDPAQRAMLTGLGAVAMMTCQSVPGVLSLHTSGRAAPVGPTPFHVLVAIDDDADPDEVIEALHERLDAIARNAGLYRAQLLAMLSAPPSLTPQQTDAQIKAIARMRSISEREAHALILGNTALQRVMIDHAGGAPAWAALERLSAEDMRTLASELLSREKRRVTVLSPRTPAPRP